METLQICKNLLLYNSPQSPDSKYEKGPSLKLAISFGNNKVGDAVNGFIIRDGPYIVDLNLSIKNHYFNKHVNRLRLKNPIVLESIVNCLNYLNDAINELQELSNSDKKEVNEEECLKCFVKLSELIKSSKNSLQIPTDPEMIFPLHVTNEDNFESDIKGSENHEISVDFYTCDNQISLDLRSLHKVHEKPWCEIDKSTGKSYVDNIRDEMKQSSSTPSDTNHNPNNNNTNNNNFFSSLIHHFKNKPDAMDYINRAVTYNGHVVLVDKKFEVCTDDPILISILSKLNSLDKKINSIVNIYNCF
ncbi:RAV2 Regulator of V-ATPase in vacuolar membrane protein 2 [Candida maltosa Xu316]